MKLRRKAVDIVVTDDERRLAAETKAPAAPPVVSATQVESAPTARASKRKRARGSVDSPIHWMAPNGDTAFALAAGPGDGGRIGDMLVQRGLVTPEQLDHALAEQVASGRRLGAQLIELGAVSEREFVGVLVEQLGLRVADLRLTLPEPEAVKRLSEATARRYEVAPVRVTPDGLEVAVHDALDEDTRSTIEADVGGPIITVLASASEINRAINQAYMALDGVERQVQAYEDLVAASRPKDEPATSIMVDDNAPVVQVVTMLLTQAVRDRASDIHIEPQDGVVRVRFRVDGVLSDVTRIPGSMAQALIGRIKVMADMNIVERRRPQDGQIQATVDGRPLDIRVATTATIWGEKAVLRLLDKTRSLRSLSELGMAGDARATFSRLIRSPFGMVICAGPTGSGKTTSLYAALTEINSAERNITTIEDPVEYVIPTINQIQVNQQAGLTFADGLKSIMRQDPDVILVGEIRDVETARIAVQSALTGHFVLSSIHATDTVTSLQRLRDMGVEPFLITSSVLAVMSQRLVRRICNSCREPFEPSADHLAFFEQHTSTVKQEWWHGGGCNLCGHTGYASRLGVYELLPVTEKIRQLVIEDAGYDELRAAAVGEGMRTLRDEALRLISEDVTTIEETIRSVYVR